MAKRKINTTKKDFLELLKDLSKKELDERKRVGFAKRFFLLEKKEDIKRAVEAGYPYDLITQALTEELYSVNVPKILKWKSTEGEDMEIIVKFTIAELEDFLEE